MWDLLLLRRLVLVGHVLLSDVHVILRMKADRERCESDRWAQEDALRHTLPGKKVLIRDPTGTHSNTDPTGTRQIPRKIPIRYRTGINVGGVKQRAGIRACTIKRPGPRLVPD